MDRIAIKIPVWVNRILILIQLTGLFVLSGLLYSLNKIKSMMTGVDFEMHFITSHVVHSVIISTAWILVVALVAYSFLQVRTMEPGWAKCKKNAMLSFGVIAIVWGVIFTFYIPILMTS